MRDDPTQTSADWSFLRDTRTRWPVDGSSWLFTQVVKDAKMQSRFVVVEQGPFLRFRSDSVEQYERAVTRFQEKLAVLVQYDRLADHFDHFFGCYDAEIPHPVTETLEAIKRIILNHSAYSRTKDQHPPNPACG